MLSGQYSRSVAKRLVSNVKLNCLLFAAKRFARQASSSIQQQRDRFYGAFTH
jgi:hypothetical protein